MTIAVLLVLVAAIGWGLALWGWISSRGWHRAYQRVLTDSQGMFQQWRDDKAVWQAAMAKEIDLVNRLLFERRLRGYDVFATEEHVH